MASDVMPSICERFLDLDKHINTMMTISSRYNQAGFGGEVDSVQAKAAKRAEVVKNLLLQAKADHQYVSDLCDGLNRPAIITMDLKGTGQDARQRQKQEAIGGMRNPRLSLRRVPGHIYVGKQVAKITH